MYRRLVLALSVSIATLALGAATASAAESISINFGSDPTEEVPLPISVTWSSADSDPAVFVTVKPAGGQGCAASYAADEPNSTGVIYETSPGSSGTLSTNRTFDDPGAFTLCGYLQHTDADTAPRKATGPVTLNVRSARASVAVNAPPRVDPGKTFAVSLPLTTEVGRELFLTVKRAGGRGCEATYSLDDPNSEDVLYENSVQGAQTVSENMTASATKGTYLLCAYVQESSDDSAPEATASAQFLVGPDACASARTALTRARKTVRVAEAATKKYRAAEKRDRKLARRAHGAKRRHYKKLAKLAHSRYHSALRRRAKARAKLVDRQADVTKACGTA